MPLRVGQRVRLTPGGGWPPGAIGRVVDPTENESQVLGSTKSSCTRNGQPVCWVRFDRPQLDGNGDGPYGRAEISEMHLDGDCC
jgi:hypothetical protein